MVKNDNVSFNIIVLFIFIFISFTYINPLKYTKCSITWKQ